MAKKRTSSKDSKKKSLPKAKPGKASSLFDHPLNRAPKKSPASRKTESQGFVFGKSSSLSLGEKPRSSKLPVAEKPKSNPFGSLKRYSMDRDRASLINVFAQQGGSSICITVSCPTQPATCACSSTFGSTCGASCSPSSTCMDPTC